jgi:hypothetical protein
MGDNKLFIFDIDSALDKLEDDLINNEAKTVKFSSENKDEEKEITTKSHEEECNNVSDEICENNGNDARDKSANASLSEVNFDVGEYLENEIKIQTCSHIHKHQIALQIQHKLNIKLRTMTHNFRLQKRDRRFPKKAPITNYPVQ